MSDLTLTKTRLAGGVWEGILTRSSDGAEPQLSVTSDETVMDGLELTPEGARKWTVRFVVPTNAINDGVQAFLITDGADGDVLASFSVIAGEAAGDDLRAEIELLRAELDMLKRAFRRHCVETT